jgi:hypothetical protein
VIAELPLAESRAESQADVAVFCGLQPELATLYTQRALNAIFTSAVISFSQRLSTSLNQLCRYPSGLRQSFSFSFHLPPFTFLSLFPTEPSFVSARSAARSCGPSNFHRPWLDRLSAYTQPSQIPFSSASFHPLKAYYLEKSRPPHCALTCTSGVVRIPLVPFSPPFELPHMYLRA